VNLNILRKSKNTTKYNQLLKEYDLQQLINVPTRIKGVSMTTIDHVVTNRNDIGVEILKNSPTDHFMIQMKFGNATSINARREKVWIKSWREYSKAEANRIIDERIWINFRCPTCDFANLKLNLDVVLSKLVKNVCVRPSQVRFDNELYQLKKDVKMAFERASFTQNGEDERAYFELMQLFKIELKRAKNNKMRDNLIRNKNDSKKLWASLSKLYRQNDALPKQIMHDDDIIDGDREIAECLNSFFIYSIDEIVRSICQPGRNDYNDLIPRCNNVMEFNEPVTMREVKNIIIELKKKSFDDGINGKLLCDLLTNSAFMKCMTNVVNDSLQKSVMPRALKRSVVTPKAKARVLSEPKSFRPVNNLPVIEKIIERVVFNRLLSHVTVNELLSECQYGFRQSHSTESAVLDITHRIIEAFEDGKCLILVSLDFRRAFETVNRNVLCEKMKIYGCSERVVAWFKDYLADREQVVKYNGEYSLPRTVVNGLPQGSKLSNLLFILFVNDIEKQLKGADVTMFADDTLLVVECEKVEEGIAIMNQNLSMVDDWMRFNSMAMNIEKCTAMVVNASSDAACNGINFCDMPIKIVKSLRYLGVIIDNEINLQSHFEIVMSKINKNVGLLRRLAQKMDFNSRKIFFKSIILPSIDYCSSFLMLMDETKLDRIQKAVNKAMRCVLMCGPLTPIDEMCAQIGVGRVKKRVQLNSLLFINKIIVKGVPLRMKRKFVLNREARQRQLRNDSKIKLPLWKCAVSRRSIFYEGARMYNEVEIVDGCSFKMNCINYLNS
jgi:hypothetical protein